MIMMNPLASSEVLNIAIVKGAGGVPRSDAKKGANTGRLTGELLLLATPSARLTSSNSPRHAAARHLSLHNPTRGPFSAYFHSSLPLPPYDIIIGPVFGGNVGSGGVAARGS